MIVAALAVLAAGCDAFTPEVGKPIAAICQDQDSDPDRVLSYKNDIRPIFEEYCFVCHTATGRFPIGLEVGRLDLATYTSLRAGGAIGSSRDIVPGQPCESILRQKISPAPPFGARMPLSGPPFVDEDEIQLIHDWIAEGARDN